MPTPVFILGKHRSGTTWLGNLLCQHPDVYGVQNPREHGIWESMYFSGLCRQLRRDPSTTAGFREWTQVMAATNYLRFSDFPIGKLADLGPDTCPELFRKIMNYCANVAGARVWIEKTPAHTLIAARLAREYPDARFLAIRRRFEDWLRSSFRFWERRHHKRVGSSAVRLLVTARLVASRARYEKALLHLRRDYRDRLLEIDYEELVSDRDRTLRRICSFLDIDALPNAPGDIYRPNSSFTSGVERHSALSWGQLLAGFIVYSILRVLPRWLMEAPYRILGVVRKPSLPDWVWAESREEGPNA